MSCWWDGVEKPGLLLCFSSCCTHGYSNLQKSPVQEGNSFMVDKVKMVRLCHRCEMNFIFICSVRWKSICERFLCLYTASFSSLQTEVQAILISFYFLKISECVHNSNLCCFIVSDVHCLFWWLFHTLAKSDLRLMPSQAETVIKGLNLSFHKSN